MNKIILFWDTWFDLFNFKIVKVKFALILRSQDFPMLYQNLKKVKLKIFLLTLNYYSI